ncbi:ABC transporter ATP-binding protein [Breoghania sp.]|uniref:ABC transporter ATP-binding protein n=1 Tax=Breoghania sp. TaxID=2065378 RepID=UPI002AA86A76|nr:ABC transporter ATP-binding protein [Breoghania sp.]
MTLLSLSRLAVAYGNTRVVKDVTLSVGAGDFVGLIGPNGAGKSSLMRAALGLVEATGEILLDGDDSRLMGADARARKVAYLPQEHEIAWPVSVRRVVELGRMPHRSGLWGANPRWAEERAIVDKAMDVMGIRELDGRRATELSGGEKVRVLIARALAQHAPLLLADEPTSGLDPAHQIACMETFKSHARSGGAVLACLHDLGLAARWCNRIVLMREGEIVADGAPGDVLTPQVLADVYGIRVFMAETEGRLVVQPLDLVRHS